MTSGTGGTGSQHTQLHDLATTKWWAKLSLDDQGQLVEKFVLTALWDRLVKKDFTNNFQTAVKNFIWNERGSGDINDINNLAYRAGLLPTGLFKKRTIYEINILCTEIGIETLNPLSAQTPANQSLSSSSNQPSSAPTPSSQPAVVLSNQSPESTLEEASHPNVQKPNTNVQSNVQQSNANAANSPAAIVAETHSQHTPLSAHNVAVILAEVSQANSSQNPSIASIAKTNGVALALTPGIAQSNEIAKSEVPVESAAKPFVLVNDVEGVGKRIKKYNGEGFEIVRNPESKEPQLKIYFPNKQKRESGVESIFKSLEQVIKGKIDTKQDLRYGEGEDGTPCFTLSSDESRHFLGFSDNEKFNNFMNDSEKELAEHSAEKPDEAAAESPSAPATAVSSPQSDDGSIGPFAPIFQTLNERYPELGRPGLQINRGGGGALGIELYFVNTGNIEASKKMEAAKKVLEVALSQKMGKNYHLDNMSLSESRLDNGYGYFIQLTFNESAHLLGYDPSSTNPEFSNLLKKCWEFQGKDTGTEQIRMVSPEHSRESIQQSVERYGAKKFNVIERGGRFQLQLVFPDKQTYEKNLGALSRDLSRLFRGIPVNLVDTDPDKSKWWRFREDNGNVLLTLSSNESFHFLGFEHSGDTVEDREASFDLLMSQCEGEIYSENSSVPQVSAASEPIPAIPQRAAVQQASAPVQASSVTPASANKQPISADALSMSLQPSTQVDKLKTKETEVTAPQEAIFIASEIDKLNLDSAGFQVLCSSQNQYYLKLNFEDNEKRDAAIEKINTLLGNDKQIDPSKQNGRLDRKNSSLTLSPEESMKLLGFDATVAGTQDKFVAVMGAFYDFMLKQVIAEYAKIDSSKLIDTGDIQFETREDFHREIQNGHWSPPPPPLYCVDPIVDDEMLKHLQCNKKKTALSVKYVKGDMITNMEGAFSSIFVNSIYSTCSTGDMHWYGSSLGARGEVFQNKVRPVIMSGDIHPDFELSNPNRVDRGEVMMPVVRLTREGFKKDKVPPEKPVIISKEDKKNDALREKYEGDLRKVALHRLTANGLPALDANGNVPLEKDKPLLTHDNVVIKLEELILAKTEGQDLSKVMQNQFVKIGDDIISLEVLFNDYVGKLRRDLRMLEGVCANRKKGYIFTINPAVIFAKQLNKVISVDPKTKEKTRDNTGTQLLNRLQLLAFKHLANTPEGKELFKKQAVFSMSNFGDPNVVQLYEKVIKGSGLSIPAVTKDEIYNKKVEKVGGKLIEFNDTLKDSISYGGQTISLEGLILLKRRNGDPFGYNETNEGLLSLEGVEGMYSDIAEAVDPAREDIVTYVVRG